MTEVRREHLDFRAAQEADGTALASFRCSNGRWWEDDVERFVQTQALARAMARETLLRLFVVTAGSDLVAVTAHRPELISVQTGEGQLRGVLAENLQLVALALPFQGRMITGGERLSDVVFRSLMTAALQDRREAVLTGIVAAPNVRSLALCRRNGLRSEIAHDARHVRLTGRFARRD